ncbi:MAG TPA: DUF1573 domain-containing protein [Bacteroidia bacterium]|nr:DUF1573 domain-containing protein [Bacteroidia bacterium]HNT80856.1 DUF1573 domain-containing protein [Bacteroidia bacterium]
MYFRKISFLIPVLFLSLTQCTSKSEQDKIQNFDPEVVDNPASADGIDKNAKTALMVFDETSHHFGTVKEGNVVTHRFTFKNTGTQELIINNARASCGCTVPEFTKTPVKPGASGWIDVSFKSEGRSGMESKTISVVSNAVPSTRVLTISAEVVHE